MRQSPPRSPSGVTGSDVDLAALIRNGPPPAADAALDELYRRHRGPVLAYARRCTRDSHTAEDLVSEAFTRTLHAVRGGSGPEGAWRPYLLTTVRRTAAAWSRTGHRTSLAPDFEAWLSEMRTEESVEEQTLRREDAVLVLRAFRSLPERWQTALWHSAVEGESPDRIAPLLGLSPSGVTSLTARAREGLREAYLTAHVEDPAASPECRHFSELLAASIRRAGRHRRTHRGLERHLADCTRCRRADTELRELNGTLRAALPVGVLLWAGASYGAKPAAAASGAAPVGASSGLSAAAKAGAVGAAVLVIALGGYAILPERGQPPIPPPPSPTTGPSTPPPTSTPERSEPPAGTTPPSHTPSPPATQPQRSAAPPPEPFPSWSPAADDRTRLPIASTGRCMDISADEGAEPYEAECDGVRSQQWELLVDRAAQEVRIRNRATGMCLIHTGTESDGAPVRQMPDACRSTATTARWTYFPREGNTVAFAQSGSSLHFLGLDDWHAAGEGEPHDPAIGTTTNYYDTPSLRFRYDGAAFGG
ncbi:sigma-70 family RNA polymerase sigma factor [Streptomyces sp. B8F3]|uniref:sigma-70 family RNA polymerase sigma factor n=1 Tax=Streptomyces sp. B8F3 TaxID=3153573 RepID=UPI00325D4F37